MTAGGDPGPYRAPWWLPGGHLQTLAAPLLERRRPAYVREFWDTPDGDGIHVDWAGPIDAGRWLVLFHGLEGNSGSHHVRSLVLQALEDGNWRCAIPHFRGCSGRPNRLPRAYHAADHEEIEWILKRLQAAAPRGTRICPVGVSLGGCALVKWLSESRRDATSVVCRAAAVSAPLDLESMASSLSQGFSRVYSWYFLSFAGLRRKALDKLVRFPREWGALRIGAAAIRGVRTLADFDRSVTAPLHGFADEKDYWRQASQTNVSLDRIAVPMLLLHAGNDPFLPASALPQPAQLPSLVTLDLPPQGGHAGFPCGNRWMARRIVRFLST